MSGCSPGPVYITLWTDFNCRICRTMALQGTVCSLPFVRLIFHKAHKGSGLSTGAFGRLFDLGQYHHVRPLAGKAVCRRDAGPSLTLERRDPGTSRFRPRPMFVCDSLPPRRAARVYFKHVSLARAPSRFVTLALALALVFSLAFPLQTLHTLSCSPSCVATAKQ